MSTESSTTDVRALLVHAEWLRRLATRLAGGDDAEDAVQDTWVAAMQSPPAGDADSVRPWLGQVLHNFLRRRWRQGGTRRRAQATLEHEAAQPPTPGDLIERGQIQQQL